jgi:hypothetical protein
VVKVPVRFAPGDLAELRCPDRGNIVVTIVRRMGVDRHGENCWKVRTPQGEEEPWEDRFLFHTLDWENRVRQRQKAPEKQEPTPTGYGSW